MQMENYEVRVEENPHGNGVIILINGEEHKASAFEFSAPSGNGLAVRTVTRLELVPATLAPSTALPRKQ